MIRHDTVIDRGTEVFIIRNGIRGIVHAATNLGSKHGTSGTFTTLCARRIRWTTRLHKWRGPAGVTYWQDDECNRCADCSRLSRRIRVR